MPKTKEQCNAIKDGRKTQIILVAIDLFAFKGYGETSIDDITSLSKCSHGLFYHYYGNKEQLFAAVMKYAIDTMANLLRTLSIDKSDPSGSIKNLLTHLLNIVADDNDNNVALLYLILNLYLQKDKLPKPPSNHKINENVKPIFTVIYDLICEGQKIGIFYQDEDPLKYTIAIVAMIKGLAFNRIKLGYKNFSCPNINTIMHLLMKGE